jgi:hypothetical protein
MEKISWNDRVGNEVLSRVKEERNVLQTTQISKVHWRGHIFRSNCLLKHVIEGKIEGRTELTGKRGRRRKSYRMALRK